MSAVNIKQLYVTKNSRIDISMNQSGIYLSIYKPVSTKQREDGKELPIFRKIESDGAVIENKVTIKFDEREFGLLKWIMEEYLKYISNEKVTKKILMLSKLDNISVLKNEKNGNYFISFYRPTRPFNIQLLKNGISITINDKSKNPAEVYSTMIHITAFPYIISVFDFVIKEYLKKYKYEIKDNRQNNNRIQQQEQRTNNSVSNDEIAEPIMDDSEDDFDFE